MPYTPPNGGAITADFDPAYTPPSGGAISAELGEYGGGGQSNTLDVAGQITIQAHPPAGQFNGTITTLSSSGSVTVSAHDPVAFLHTQVLAVAGGITITGPAPTFLCSNDLGLSGCGSITITAHAEITQTFRVRAGILSKYSYPAVALDAYGQLTITAHSGITQKFVLHSGKLSAYNYTQQVAVSVFSPYNFRVAGSLRSSYNIYAPIAGSVSAGYDVRTVNVVSRYITAPYRLPVGSYVLGVYSAPVPVKVSVAVASSYTLVQPVKIRVSVTDTYDLIIHVKVGQRTLSSYTLVQQVKIGQRTLSSYTLVQQVKIGQRTLSSYTLVQQVKVRASIFDTYALITHVLVRQGTTSTYAMPVPLIVGNSVQGSYKYQLIRTRSVQSKYSVTSHVRKAVALLYDCLGNTPVRRSITGVFTSHTSGALIVDTRPTATVDAIVVPLESVQVSISEGEFLWKCSMVLTNVADYMSFTKDKPFTVDIGGEIYSFIVDTKELSRRSPANISAMVSGLSPSAVYTEPRSDMIQQVWDEPVMAAAAAQSIIPGLDWRVIDWLIPAYRLAANNVSPQSVVSVIATAIGATLESEIDGSVYVRSLYPVTVTDYYTVLPDHVVIETEDIFAVSETYPSDRIYNRIVISDVEDQISDRLEWIPAYDKARVGVVRAYIYPWRTNVSLTHTGRATTYILDPSVVLEEYTEIVEVFQGKGSTSNPIYSIVDVQYEANNVGALSFSQDSPDFTVSATNPNTVLRLIYKSRSLDYPVGIVEGAPTQFLLSSPPL